MKGGQIRIGFKNKLSVHLDPSELKLLPRSYDIVGDIAVIRIPNSLKRRSRIIAEAIMKTNKHIKTVLNQATPISGVLRLRKLEWTGGEKKSETIHKESRCVFKVDLERCYFSPRLSYERVRIAKLVKPFEVILNMFSGVGCFSIIIAKHSRARKVFSIDINPVAIRYQKENVRLNRVEGIVEPIEGDAKEVILERLQNVADRVLMPLPELAYDYLDYAILALKPEGWIHYYDFEHAGKDEGPIEKVTAKVSKKISSLKALFEIKSARIVRTVGPRWYQIVLDIAIRKLST